MIIKSLVEIAYYSSVLVLRKVGETLEAVLPNIEKIQEKESMTHSIPAQKTKVFVVEKGRSKSKMSEKVVEEIEIIKTPNPKSSLADKTKKELYQMAQDLDVVGRSTMNKAELQVALEQAINSKK